MALARCACVCCVVRLFVETGAEIRTLQPSSLVKMFLASVGRCFCNIVASNLPVSGRAERFHLAGTAPPSSHRPPPLELSVGAPVTLTGAVTSCSQLNVYVRMRRRPGSRSSSATVAPSIREPSFYSCEIRRSSCRRPAPCVTLCVSMAYTGGAAGGACGRAANQHGGYQSSSLTTDTPAV